MKPRPNRPSTSHRSRWPCVALAASCWISPRRNFVVSWQGGRVESFTTSVGKIYGKIVVQCCPSVPMLHMLPVDSSMFLNGCSWMSDDWWCPMISDDFWWFQRDLPVWLAAKSLEVAPRRFSPRSLKAFPQRSELELAGAQHGSEQKWEYINQFGWFRIQPISND